MGWGLSKAWKSVTKVFTKAVDVVWDVTKGIVTGEYLIKATGAILEFAGGEIVDDILGLDKLGNEIENVGSDIYQIGKVLGGEYHDDMKKIEDLQNRVQKEIDKYNSNVDNLVDKLESLIAFHEIFQMAASNRLDSYTDMYGPQIAGLIEQLNNAIAKLQSEYDFVIGLTQGAFLQRIIGSIIMIIGGLTSDLGDIVNGRADGATWLRAVSAIVTVILLVLAIVTGQLYLIPAILASIAVFMMLDGMYANGAATGAIMSLLDFMFNDVLNLDDLVGKDFNKFDKDHEDYKEMVMYTQIAFSLASAGTQWGMAPPTGGPLPGGDYLSRLESSGGSQIGTGALPAIQANVVTTFFGISTSTYSSIYKAYSAASSVNDVMNSKKAYDALADKFREDALKVESVIESKYRKNFMKHYKDTAYFLQDQQEFIDRYIWSMSAENMYVDPYGTTPVANIRFTPDKDTRVMSFGFEDMFDESNQAGSKGYFNSILYGN